VKRLLAMAFGGLLGVVLLAGATVCLTSGCSTIGYLAQSVGGHLSLLRAARPVPEWLTDASTPAPMRERLALSQRMRDFAVHELKLPDNRSYRGYADLQRPAAVWNVIAAPELSLQLKTWCFPVVGCVGYRGYFDQAAAQAYAKELQTQGLEVMVYGVPAYSTLGWSEWLGGDPLLNTFIRFPEGELARMIFHELAHQVAYASGDTMFNESFATAVERLGADRWLSTHASPEARMEYTRFDARRAQFRALTAKFRAAMDGLYRGAGTDEVKRTRKAELMASMRDEYSRLKMEEWDGFAGYDGWFANANNASFGVLAAYNELVPSFVKLYERQDGDFERFYAEVRRLAALPKDQRRAQLAAATGD
jgi:predicted aminopeptidase